MSTVKEKIIELQNKSKNLRDKVPEILTYVSVDDVTSEMITRDEWREELQKVTNYISDLIGQMESQKRDIATMRREQAIDIDKLDRYKFQLLRARKQANA